MAAVAHAEAAIESRVASRGSPKARIISDRRLKAASLADRRAAADGSSLQTLCERLRLSSFERLLLACAAGSQLSPGFASLIERASPHGALTFGFALEHLPEAHWNAITPAAALRRWQLILPMPPGRLLDTPLVLDERVLHLLLGIDQADPRVLAHARPCTSALPLTALQEASADCIAALWQKALETEGCPQILLTSASPKERRAVACRAAEKLGWQCWVAASSAYPGDWSLLWERESLLRSTVLILETDAHEHPAPNHILLSESLRTPLVLSGGRWPATPRKRFTVEVPEAGPSDLVRLWNEILGEAGKRIHDDAARAASQFRLTLEQAVEVAAEANDARAEQRSRVLWDASRRAARTGMEELAERLVTLDRQAELVLPPGPQALLDDLIHAARHQHRALETWGMARHSGRGLGLTALFAGPSGTGKTLAAEFIARELHLDIYRIDLSSVVSKFIGDTEKHLRRLFDAADHSGAILLFDEADSLFNKRSEVRDSHDRFANIQVGYLLQRMESYRGIAILTTNLRNSLDEAFLRRLRFVIAFPFPDAASRERIWRLSLPERERCAPIDWQRLARLDISGGNIRNIALSASIRAAGENRMLTMRDIARAAQVEYAKLERAMAAHELEGWT